MIKAIIFDCFGVLVGPSLEPFIARYLAHDPELVSEAHEINRQACIGLLSYEQQIDRFTKLAGITEAETREIMDSNPPNTPLLDYIRDELKPRYKIGFLSNASDNWMDELFTPDQRELFDEVVLSYEVKLAKPDAEIYELTAKRLGVSPNECVFVDDIESYCQGARIVGMQAIRYMDLQSLRQQLEKLL